MLTFLAVVIEEELRPKRNGGSFLLVRMADRSGELDAKALGLEIIERHVGRFPGFPLELKTILQHFIVSHHGDLDKGALRRPMLPEVLCALAPGFDGRATGTGVQADRFGTRRRTVHIVCPVSRTSVVPRV